MIWKAPAGPVSESNQPAASSTGTGNGAEQAPATHSCPAAVKNTCCGKALEAKHTVGPFLRYAGLEPDATNPDLRWWLGTCLVVTQAPTEQLALVVQDAKGVLLQSLAPEAVLDAFGPWTCLRFSLRFAVRDQGQEVHYNITVNGQELRKEGPYSFHIAGWSEPVRWGFYSCSGFSMDVTAETREGHWKGVGPLWSDVLIRHETPGGALHIMVGGGDQLYCDDVWQCPALKAFLDMPNKDDRQRAAKQGLVFTQEMRQQVDAYYFHHYCTHFSLDPVGEVYARIPQVMTWDDHDIFDGWGSYPRYLQSSQVFKQVFDVALRWFCVFQKHCSKEEKQGVEVLQLGQRLALIVPDQRHMRLKDQILPVEHYMEFTMLCQRLPKEVEHVVFVSTVPVVYPHVPGAQSVLGVVGNGCIGSMLERNGVSLMGIFKEPELMDDLDDHWSAKEHQDERRFLIENLQMLAKYRGCRVSLISGDVHVCGAGYLVSHPAPVEEVDLEHDYRFMHQIISSAIVNPPPPGGLMKVLAAFSKGGHINRHTSFHMMRLRPEGQHRKLVPLPLMNKRNWCEVVEQPLDAAAANPGALTFILRVEDSPSNQALTEYHIIVPALTTKAGQDEQRQYFDVHDVPRGAMRCFGLVREKAATQWEKRMGSMRR